MEKNKKALIAKAQERFSETWAGFTWLMSWFGPAIMRVRVHYTFDMLSGEIPTFGMSDSYDLFIHPEAYDHLPDDGQVYFVYAHELEHPILRHGKRGRLVGVEPWNKNLAYLWNLAADMEINDDLHEMAERVKWLTAVPSMVYPEDLGFPRGLTAEEYFKKLLEMAINELDKNARGYDGQDGKGHGRGNQRGEGNKGKEEPDGEAGNSGKENKDAAGEEENDHGGSGSIEELVKKLKEKLSEMGKRVTENGSASDGIKRDWEQKGGGDRISEFEKEYVSDKVAEEISREASRDPGTIPAGLKRWADERIRAKKIPWQKLFRRSLSNMARRAVKRETFVRKNRRQQRSYGDIIILPGKKRFGFTATFIADASGSMTKKDLGLTISLMRQASYIADLRVFSADMELYEIKKHYNRAQKLEELIGGGGTDMAYAAQKAYEKTGSKLIVVATDGYTPWPETKPEYQMIALITCEEKMADVPPFIKAIYVEPRE